MELVKGQLNSKPIVKKTLKDMGGDTKAFYMTQGEAKTTRSKSCLRIVLYGQKRKRKYFAKA